MKKQDSLNLGLVLILCRRYIRTYMQECTMTLLWTAHPLNFRYLPPLTKLAAQTEFSQLEKIVAAHQRMAMACNLNGKLLN